MLFNWLKANINLDTRIKSRPYDVSNLMKALEDFQTEAISRNSLKILIAEVIKCYRESPHGFFTHRGQRTKSNAVPAKVRRKLLALYQGS